MLPIEIQEYIFEFIQPYVTREDWRTCRHEESSSIHQLVRLLQYGKPRNHSWVRYTDWTFYEKLRFSKMEMAEWEQLFPCKSLMFSVFRKKLLYGRVKIV